MTNGQRGEVVAVDRDAGSLTVACGGRRVELDRAFLSGATRDGDPTLLHGYAMTGHVAQGATVDRCFVLASEGMSREWAYVALSRGRLSNRLYVAAQPDDARAEFAPVQPERRDPVERLAAALRESDGQVLAIDSGASESSEVRHEARAPGRATRRGSGARSSAGGISGCRGAARSSTDARERERAAGARLVEARRAEAEARHGTRRFVTRARVGGAAGRDARARSRITRPSGCFAASAASVGSSERPCRRRRPDPFSPFPATRSRASEAAASLGISLNHFERRVQPELKVVLSGQLVLIPVSELERWVQRHARLLVEAPVRPLRSSVG